MMEFVSRNAKLVWRRWETLNEAENTFAHKHRVISLSQTNPDRNYWSCTVTRDASDVQVTLLVPEIGAQPIWTVMKMDSLVIAAEDGALVYGLQTDDIQRISLGLVCLDMIVGSEEELWIIGDVEIGHFVVGAGLSKIGLEDRIVDWSIEGKGLQVVLENGKQRLLGAD